MVEVVYTDEFGEWYEGLDDHHQEAVWAAGAEPNDEVSRSGSRDRAR